MPKEDEAILTQNGNESTELSKSLATKSIHLDMSKGLVDLSHDQQDILNRLIRQNYKHFRAANGETVRFPYLEKVQGSKTKVPRAYTVTDAEGSSCQVTLSHSISGEIDQSESEIKINFSVEGHYRQGSDEAKGQGTSGDVRRILWEFCFRENAELQLTATQSPRLVKRIGSPAFQAAQRERDFFQSAYPDEKISKVFPAILGQSTRFITPDFPGKTVVDIMLYDRLVFRKQVLVITKAILEELKELYKKGVAHGDLSPRNIIFDGQGIKLVDFALAGVVNEEKVTRDLDRLRKTLKAFFRYASVPMGASSDEALVIGDIKIELSSRLDLLAKDYSSSGKLDRVVSGLTRIIADLDTVSRRSSRSPGCYVQLRQRLQQRRSDKAAIGRDLTTLKSFIERQLKRMGGDSDKAKLFRKLLVKIQSDTNPNLRKLVAWTKECTMTASYKRYPFLDRLALTCMFGCANRFASAISWREWEAVGFSHQELRRVHAAALQGEAGREVTVDNVTVNDFSQYRRSMKL